MSRNNGIIILIAAIVMAGSFAAIFSSGETPSSSPTVTPSLSGGGTWIGTLVINPDGSLSTSAAPIVQDGNNYTLTGNIDGSVQIQREGANFDGNGFTVMNYASTSPIQLIGSNLITLKNTNIISTWAVGINIYQSSYDMIVNNTITGMTSGIFVYAPYDSIINNTVNMTRTNSFYVGTPVGIVSHGSYSNMTGNTIYIPTGSDGIVADSQHSIIESNNVTLVGGSSVGVRAISGYDTIMWNTVSVTGDNSYGISLAQGSQFNTIGENDVTMLGSWSYGVYVADGFNNITLNTVSIDGSWSQGVTVTASGTGSSQVQSNTIQTVGQNSVGIYSNYYNSTISYNVISTEGDSSYGIDSMALGAITMNTVSVSGFAAHGIYSAMNDRMISENTINAMGDYSYGLYITGAYDLQVLLNEVIVSGNYATAAYYSGTYSKISYNNVTAGLENGTAIFVKILSANNMILNNSFSYSSTGLMASTTSGNLYVGNNFINDTIAFELRGHSTDKYYHNSFVNYSSFIISSTTASVWDNGYPSGGNYWSTYGGVDLFSGPGQNITGPDGIGDSQFNLSGSNIDYYPLMGKWVAPAAVFIETGLAPGTLWSVTFNGTMVSSTTDTISFDITSAVYADYAYSVANVAGYNITANASGTISYTGHDIMTQVEFAVYIPPPETYPVTFTENGLPAESGWSMTFGGVEKTSYGTQISFEVINGTYDFSTGVVQGYSADPSTGSVVVSGSGHEILIQFSVVNYTVTFTNNGLPTGTEWSITFDGSLKSSTASDISFEASNGTYDYGVGMVPGYAPNPSAGTVMIDGADQGILIQFTVVNYTVTFNEGGLPTGTSWSMTFNGITKASTTSSITFEVSNGTYDYSTGTVSGYTALPVSGTVTVNGQDKAITIQYSEVTYTATFNSEGLPAGITWYVNLSDGRSFSTSTSSITMDLTNGTYVYTIDNLTGYNVTPQSGSITVTGSSPDPVTVHFNKIPAPETPSGLPFWLYIIIGIIVGAGLTAVGLVIYYRRK